MFFTTRIGVSAALLGALGCGGSDVPEDGNTARPPASAGQVWEVDHPDEPTGNPGALQAFVSGLHVVVVDGNELYAGMTRLDGTPKAGGSLVFQLSRGRTAELASAAEGLEIRFSTGEMVSLKKRAIEK
jgi:hypothetical protein